MINEWSLRDEILAVTHRWPLWFLAILIGCLLGWFAVKFVPTPYRAETSLNVSYNGDLILRNPDDYKNGQMAQLNVFIRSKDVLSETLNRLRKRDEYWNGISSKKLDSMLHVYWRNVGKWRLVAEASNPVRATQLAETWQEVALEKIGVAIFHASSTVKLDTELKATANAEMDVRQRSAELEDIRSALKDWQSTAAQSSGADQPVDSLERWRLESLAARIAKPDPAGLQLIDQIPPSQAGQNDYIPWIDQALAYLDNEAKTTQDQQVQLAAQYDEIYQNLTNAMTGSHGLTSYLRVEKLSNESLQVYPVYQRSDVALVGGVLGLLLFGLVGLGVPFLRARRR